MTPLEEASAELKKVRVWDAQKERFTRINVSVQVVYRIVKHLEAGGSLYDLHKGKQMPVAALNTVRKVRDAWKIGALDTVLAAAVEQILENEPLTFVSRDQIETAQERLSDQYRDSFGGKTWRWDVRHLEEIGLYPDQALDVLMSYDKHYELNREAQRRGRKFSALNLYLAVHYNAIFHLWFPRAPFHYIDLAAHWHADALLESGTSDEHGYTNYAMDMLRYEIWRTDKQLNAYYTALGRYNLGAKRIYEVRENINRANQPNSYIHFQSDKGTLVQPPIVDGETDWEQAMNIMEPVTDTRKATRLRSGASWKQALNIMEEEEEDYGDFDKARREKWLDDDLLDD